MSFFDLFFNRKKYSEREQELIDYTLEVKADADARGVPIYLWNNVADAIEKMWEDVEDPAQRKFYLKGALYLARRKGDPCWLLNDILNELLSQKNELPLKVYNEQVQEIIVDLSKFASHNDVYRRERILQEPRVNWWFEESDKDKNSGYIMPYQLLTHLFLPIIRRLSGIKKDKLTPKKISHAWSITRSINRIIDVGCSEINFLIHNGLHNIIECVPNYTVASSELIVKFAQNIREAYDAIYGCQPDRLLLADIWESLTCLFNKRTKNLGLVSIRDMHDEYTDENYEIVTAGLLFDIMKKFGRHANLAVLARALADVVNQLDDDDQFRFLYFTRQILYDKKTRFITRDSIFSILSMMKEGVPLMTNLARLRRALKRIYHISSSTVRYAATESPDIVAENIAQCSAIEQSLLKGKNVEVRNENLIRVLTALQESNNGQFLGYVKSNLFEPPLEEEGQCEVEFQDLIENSIFDEASVNSQDSFDAGQFVPFKIPFIRPLNGTHRLKPSNDAMKIFLEKLLVKFYKIKYLVNRIDEDPPWKHFSADITKMPLGHPIAKTLAPYVKYHLNKVADIFSNLQTEYFNNDRKELAMVFAEGVNSVKKLLKMDKLRIVHWAESLCYMIEIASRHKDVTDRIVPYLSQALLEFGAFTNPSIGFSISFMESVEETNLSALGFCKSILEQTALTVSKLTGMESLAHLFRSTEVERFTELQSKISTFLGFAKVQNEIDYVTNYELSLDKNDGEVFVALATKDIEFIANFSGLTSIDDESHFEDSDKILKLVLTKLPENTFVGIASYNLENKSFNLRLKKLWPKAIFKPIALDLKKNILLKLSELDH